METDFDYLRCPMCGGELIYSEGTHDLCCRRNGQEAGEDQAAAEGEESVYAASGDYEVSSLCDEREAYGAYAGGGAGAVPYAGLLASAAVPAPAAGRTGRGGARLRKARPIGADRPHVSRKGFRRSAGLMAKEGAEQRKDGCVFALSFTGSGGHGTLWSLRTDHRGTNYFSLMRLLQRIEKRVEKGEPLAPNIPNTARKVERSPVLKLAFRYGLEEEDIYSIRHSTESVARLALFYGITEKEVKEIKRASIDG